MIYFDNAATTFPKPRSVLRETNVCLRKYCGNPGRSSHRLSMRAGEEIFRAREAVASLLGTNQPENIVFTQNATYALNMALKTALTPPCHVLISDLEHNSVLRPINKLARTAGIAYSVFSTEGDIGKNIRAARRPDTRAIVSTLASNVTGKRIPLPILSAMKKKYGLTLILDASQVIGHEPLPLPECPYDILCAPGHKGLFGIQGVGFACFADAGCYHDSFIEGGSGSESLNPLMPEMLPEHFEAGTLPTPAIVSLRAGIDFIRRTGLDGIGEKLHRLTARAMECLLCIPGLTLYGEGESGILSFNLGTVPSSVIASELDAVGICTRSGLHCAPLIHEKLGTTTQGAVRVSFSFFNKMREIDALYRRLRELARIYA